MLKQLKLRLSKLFRRKAKIKQILPDHTVVYTKGFNCPACREPLNAHTPSQGHPTIPHPGDAGVCVHCGAILIFDESLRLGLISQEDWDRLPPALHELLMKVSHQSGRTPGNIRAMLKVANDA